MPTKGSDSEDFEALASAGGELEDQSSEDSRATGRKSKASHASKKTGKEKKTKKEKKDKKVETPNKKVKKKTTKCKVVSPEKMCGVMNCVEKKKGNSGECSKHTRDIAAMRFQAEKAGELKYFEALLRNREQLAKALDEFDRQNPPGRFRKTLIDWALFKRTFAVTISVTVRASEEEWTWPEFKEEKQDMNWSLERIKRKWQELLDSDANRTGDGYNAVIWIPKRRVRNRDTTHSITNAVEQGSKATRNLKAKDLKDLKGFVGRAGSSNDVFLRKAMGKASESSSESSSGEGEGSGDDDDAEKHDVPGSGKKKKTAVDLGSAVNDLYNAQEKVAVFRLQLGPVVE